MVDIAQNIIILCIILICMWAMYRVGVQEGRHRERMNMIDIINDIPTIVTPQEHVWHVVSYIIRRLQEK